MQKSIFLWLLGFVSSGPLEIFVERKSELARIEILDGYSKIAKFKKFKKSRESRKRCLYTFVYLHCCYGVYILLATRYCFIQSARVISFDDWRREKNFKYLLGELLCVWNTHAKRRIDFCTQVKVTENLECVRVDGGGLSN